MPWIPTWRSSYLNRDGETISCASGLEVAQPTRARQVSDCFGVRRIRDEGTVDQSAATALDRVQIIEIVKREHKLSIKGYPARKQM